MTPAEAMAHAMRNTGDTTHTPDRFDLAAAEDVVHQLRRLGWRVVPWNVGIGQGGGGRPRVGLRGYGAAS